MSHPEQRVFVESIRSRFPLFFFNCSVLEVGSLDINGSVRDFFLDCDYTGIDVGDGPGVDIVADGQSYDPGSASADTVISAECFEHNPFWRETFLNMHRISRGLVVVTAATTGRPEHGTRATTPEDSPLTLDLWDYYRNITEDDLLSLPLDDLFVRWEISINEDSCDIYFWGMVEGTPDVVDRNRISIEVDSARAQLGSSSTEELEARLRAALAERDRAQIERHLAVGDQRSAMQELSDLRNALDLIEGSQIWRWTKGYRSIRARWSR